jgi:hypothetical protein
VAANTANHIADVMRRAEMLAARARKPQACVP